MAPAPDSSERRDTTRALVAISLTGELAEALREAVPRELLVVKDARPGEAAAVIGSCAPFPWMIVCDANVAPAAALAAARRRPVILAWRGQAPAQAPSHALCFVRFAELAEFVNCALTRTVGGMRLGRGTGVDLDSGGTVRAAALEALVSLHPAGFDLPPAVFRSASRALARRDLSWRPARDRAAGGVLLARSPRAGRRS